MLRTNEYVWKLAQLKKETTIVNVPDIHFKEGYNLKLLNALFAKIHEINTDVIVIPGDLIDQLTAIDSDFINYLYDKLIELNKPIIISLDWHDYMQRQDKKETTGNYQALINALKTIRNVYVFANALQNRGKNPVYEINGVNFTAMSREPDLCHNVDYEKDRELHERKLKEFYENLDSYDPSLPTILGYHCPEIFHESAKITGLGKRNSLKTAVELGIPNVDLVLSGHKHGSIMPKIIGEKLSRGFVNVDDGVHLGGRYLGGLYKSADMAQIVSRGLIKFPSTNELPIPIDMLNRIYDNSFDVIRLVKK